uniref:Acyl-ACP thioesterase-like C-terminal domain-containing protein n=1 Tax=Salix viminalis TaxID=40686 RepID=A0A6N2MAH6_SALVM
MNGTATVALREIHCFSSVTGKQRGFISAASITELTRSTTYSSRETIGSSLKEVLDKDRQLLQGHLKLVLIKLQHWKVFSTFFRGEVGENGMRRDWLIRSDATGEVLVPATRSFSEHPHPFFHGSFGCSNKVLQMLNTTCVMMNQQTRGLSKMPEAKIKLFKKKFLKISKLSTNAIFTNSNSLPKRSDLDMNHHVNNVRYVNWMLERTIPRKFLENYRLTRITLEYRRECSSSDMVQSLVKRKKGDCNHTKSLKTYTHLLQITGYKESDEIARGELCGKESSKLCH